MKKWNGFLNDSLLYGMKPGLQNMETMCRYFNHPEKSFQVIHVVGLMAKALRRII